MRRGSVGVWRGFEVTVGGGQATRGGEVGGQIGGLLVTELAGGPWL